MKIGYTDEATYITEYIEFTDEHYEFAKNLQKEYENERLSICSSIMVGKDKESLTFCVNLADRVKDRGAFERGDNMYKVNISKIVPYTKKDNSYNETESFDIELEKQNETESFDIELEKEIISTRLEAQLREDMQQGRIWGYQVSLENIIIVPLGQRYHEENWIRLNIK
jgi:hypothetical protein